MPAPASRCPGGEPRRRVIRHAAVSDHRVWTEPQRHNEGEPGPDARTSSSRPDASSASRASTSPRRGSSTSSSPAPAPRASTPTDLISTLDGMGRLTLVDLGRRRDEIFRQQGITFAIIDPGRRRRAGPPVPARPRAADHPGGRVGADRARPRPAAAGAERVHRRRLPRARDRPRADRPVGAGARLAAVPPRRPRRAPAGRDLLPRRRLRPGPRRRRHAGGCSRTTAAPRRGSPTCSRTGSR